MIGEPQGVLGEHCYHWGMLGMLQAYFFNTHVLSGLYIFIAYILYIEIGQSFEKLDSMTFEAKISYY
jgi:hypothetical protein